MQTAEKGDVIKLLDTPSNDRWSIKQNDALKGTHIVSDVTDGHIYFWHNDKLLSSYHGAYEIIKRHH